MVSIVVVFLFQVDNTRNISEFDDEAQVAIQRASYDHHMKMRGLPTSQDKVNTPDISSDVLPPSVSPIESPRDAAESMGR